MAEIKLGLVASLLEKLRYSTGVSRGSLTPQGTQAPDPALNWFSRNNYKNATSATSRGATTGWFSYTLDPSKAEPVYSVPSFQQPYSPPSFQQPEYTTATNGLTEQEKVIVQNLATDVKRASKVMDTFRPGMYRDEPNVGRIRVVSETIRLFARYTNPSDITFLSAGGWPYSSSTYGYSNSGTYPMEYAGTTFDTEAKSIISATNTAQEVFDVTDGLTSEQFGLPSYVPPLGSEYRDFQWEADCSRYIVVAPEYPRVASPSVTASLGEATITELSAVTIQVEVEKIGTVPQLTYRKGNSFSCPSYSIVYGWCATVLEIELVLSFSDSTSTTIRFYSQALEEGHGTVETSLDANNLYQGGPYPELENTTQPRFPTNLPEGINSGVLNSARARTFSLSMDFVAEKAWLHVDESYYPLEYIPEGHDANIDSSERKDMSLISGIVRQNFEKANEEGLETKITAQVRYSLDNSPAVNVTANYNVTGISATESQYSAYAESGLQYYGTNSGTKIKIKAVRFENAVFLPEENLESIAALRL